MLVKQDEKQRNALLILRQNTKNRSLPKSNKKVKASEAEMVYYHTTTTRAAAGHKNTSHFFLKHSDHKLTDKQILIGPVKKCQLNGHFLPSHKLLAWNLQIQSSWKYFSVHFKAKPHSMTFWDNKWVSTIFAEPCHDPSPIQYLTPNKRWWIRPENPNSYYIGVETKTYLHIFCESPIE